MSACPTSLDFELASLGKCAAIQTLLIALTRSECVHRCASSVLSRACRNQGISFEV